MTWLIWLALLVPLLGGFLAQRRAQSVFARYGGVANRAGVTGAQLARTLLDAHGLRDVRLEPARGFLSDHYDGAKHALRLSDAFGLATLPVEFGASRRAVTLLRSTGLTDAEETGEVRSVLTAAALTYVVGLASQLGMLLFLVLIAVAAHGVAT